MAFMCPPKDETENKLKTLNDLKNVIKEIEDKLTPTINPICVPVCVPLADLQPALQQAPPPSPGKICFDPPDVLICYKTCKKKKKHSSKNAGAQEEQYRRIKQSKSRELRASILYRGCDCEKHHGLQDQCPRTECLGSPECLTEPPSCGPSEFAGGKHLGLKFDPEMKAKRHAQGGGSGGGGSRGGGRGGQGGDSIKYKCYPAVIRDPVCCNLIT